MSHHRRFASALLALAACAILAGPAPAADNVRYVSITGSNANPCTLAQPCRTMQRGINVTPPGGELRVLDSGDYGPNAVIKKSMTLSGNGNTIFVANGVVVDRANAVVALRGLTLDGQGTIQDGIRILLATAVHIERCVIHGFTIAGIRNGESVEVFVIDSVSRDNGFGVLVAGAGQPRTTIDNSRFENNGTGVSIQSGRATISRSIASGNGVTGILALNAGVTVVVRETTAAYNGGDGFRALNGTMTVDSSVAYGNGGNGLGAIGGLARISNSTFTDNAVGINNTAGGTLQTRGNNTVEGNTTNTNGTLTPIGGV